jgi:hypothetical protein
MSEHITKIIIIEEGYEPIVLDANIDPLRCEFPDCGAVVEHPGYCAECAAMIAEFEGEI